MILALLQLPSRALVAFLRIYQRAVSPVLPVIFGASCGCRFAPTCSHYAIEAVQAHGAITGGVLAIIRLIKCSPLHPGGFDPVPPRGKFSCALVANARVAKAPSRLT